MSIDRHIEIVENNDPVKKYNFIGLVIDESGSMGTMYDQAISLFNEQIETLRVQEKQNEDMETSVVVTKFSSQVKMLYKNAKVEDLKNIDKQSYIPGGGTALFDAMGQTINQLRANAENVPSDGDVAFLLIVVTDGEENSSHEFNGDSLSSMVEGLEKEGNWTFPILGANIDLQKLCSRIGIKTGGTMNFSHDSIGDASVVMSSGLTGYYGARSRGDTQVRNLYAPESNNLGDEDDRSSS